MLEDCPIWGSISCEDVAQLLLRIGGISAKGRGSIKTYQKQTKMSDV